MNNHTTCNSPGYRSPIPQLFDSFQPISSTPLCSPSSKPSDFLINKLQNNAVNIRNLAKAFNNNQYPVNSTTASCSRNSSSSVNNRNTETFNRTFEKFIPNSVPNNQSKVNRLSNNNPCKINELSNDNSSKINQLLDSGNNDFAFNNKNFMSNNTKCSFERQSVDIFLSRESAQNSQQNVSLPNYLMNSLKNNSKFNNNINSSGCNLTTNKSELHSFQPKKPRFCNLINTTDDENSQQTINLSTSNITICSGRVTEDEKSAVASVLDGLDEDSLFSDDF